MKLRNTFARCSIAAALALSAAVLSAQDNPPAPASGSTPPAGGAVAGAPGQGRTGRGNFDPAEFQKRMMDGIKDRLGFKDDAEWTAVQPLVQKVTDLRRETMTSGMGSMFRFSRRSTTGGATTGGTTNAPQGGDRGSDRRPSSFFGTPSPEAEALQKTIDDTAPAAQVKDALEKYRASKKDKEAKLVAAQDDLRKVLTVRQEALATLMGLLP